MPGRPVVIPVVDFSMGLAHVFDWYKHKTELDIKHIV